MTPQRINLVHRNDGAVAAAADDEVDDKIDL